jgi:DNA-directed RNA polymerase subunit F
MTDKESKKLIEQIMQSSEDDMTYRLGDNVYYINKDLTRRKIKSLKKEIRRIDVAPQYPSIG